MIGQKRNLFAAALSKIEINTTFDLHLPADPTWSHMCLLPKEHKPCNEPENEEPELLV